MEKVILMRKKPTNYKIVCPFKVEGCGSIIDFVGAKSGKVFEKEIPYEIYEWLRDETNAIKNGELIIKEKPEDDEYTSNVYDGVEMQSDIKNSILTKEEVEELISKGNHLQLKGKLNKLIEGIEDETKITSIKEYIYKTAVEIGMDSTSKIKVLCDWYGSDYENCGYIFDKELAD